MFIEILSVDQDVIEIHRDFPLCDQIDEDCVHERLECRRGVGKPEEHDQRFEQPSVTDEGCLPLVSFFDSDVIVTPADIELGEIPSTSEPIDYIRCEWERIPVLNGDVVKFPVVLNEPQFPVFLFDEEDWRGNRRFTRPDIPFAKLFVQELVQLPLLV